MPRRSPSTAELICRYCYVLLLALTCCFPSTSTALARSRAPTNQLDLTRPRPRLHADADAERAQPYRRTGRLLVLELSYPTPRGPEQLQYDFRSIGCLERDGRVGNTLCSEFRYSEEDGLESLSAPTRVDAPVSELIWPCNTVRTPEQPSGALMCGAKVAAQPRSLRFVRTSDFWTLQQAGVDGKSRQSWSIPALPGPSPSAKRFYLHAAIRPNWREVGVIFEPTIDEILPPPKRRKNEIG